MHLTVCCIRCSFWAGKADSQICAAMANSQELNEAYWQNQPVHPATMQYERVKLRRLRAKQQLSARERLTDRERKKERES